jgi:hypothetical protein
LPSRPENDPDTVGNTHVFVLLVLKHHETDPMLFEIVEMIDFTSVKKKSAKISAITGDV